MEAFKKLLNDGARCVACAIVRAVPDDAWLLDGYRVAPALAVTFDPRRARRSAQPAKRPSTSPPCPTVSEPEPLAAVDVPVGSTALGGCWRLAGVRFLDTPQTRADSSGREG